MKTKPRGLQKAVPRFFFAQEARPTKAGRF